MPTAIRRTVALALGVAVLLLAAAATPAAAHPTSTTAVLLDLGTDRVDVTVQLPLDELGVARGKELTAATVLEPATLTGLQDYVRAHLSATDAAGRTWTTTVGAGRVEQVDGVDTLVLAAQLAPATGGVGDFVLHDDAVVESLASHRIFVSARYGRAGPYTTVAMLSWQQLSVPVAAAVAPSTTSGFLPAVRLGLEHIADGPDHLLFLLMLLLPAPLVARAGRWDRRPEAAGATASARHAVHVVTAFAVGHSVTLLLGSLGLVHLPTRLVESGIAVSVLVSAVHAVRPLVRGGEVAVAAGFGLLHGLAFAAVITELDLGRAAFVATLLGFNLGVELAQLAAVALVLPSLVVLGRSRTYPVVRTALAGAGAVLAVGWLAERAGFAPTDPFGVVTDALAAHPLRAAAALAVVAAVVTAGRALPGRPSPQPSRRPRVRAPSPPGRRPATADRARSTG